MNHPGPSALPPTTIHSTQSISQSAAHDFLAAYLARAATDPALQPNASINEHGPVSRTTAAAPNLILHNLKRVQAGLAGEVLGQDLTVAKSNPGEDYLDVPTGAGAEGEQTGEADGDNDLEMKEPEFKAEAEAFEEQESSQAAVDKEERKKLKKERRAAEKKAKAQKANESD